MVYARGHARGGAAGTGLSPFMTGRESPKLPARDGTVWKCVDIVSETANPYRRPEKIHIIIPVDGLESIPSCNIVLGRLSSTIRYRPKSILSNCVALAK